MYISNFYNLLIVYFSLSFSCCVEPHHQNRTLLSRGRFSSSQIRCPELVAIIGKHLCKLTPFTQSTDILNSLIVSKSSSKFASESCRQTVTAPSVPPKCEKYKKNAIFYYEYKKEIANDKLPETMLFPSGDMENCIL